MAPARLDNLHVIDVVVHHGFKLFALSSLLGFGLRFGVGPLPVPLGAAPRSESGILMSPSSLSSSA